jgi:hypothetical protein
MVVRRITVSWLVHVAHLDEPVLGVSIELPRGLALSNDLRHPRIVGADAGKQLFHQRGYLVGQLGIFAIAPNRADLRDVSIERALSPSFLYCHRTPPLMFIFSMFRKESSST